MINDVKQLKQFIMWCKQQKIKKMKIKDVEFEISELDFIPEEDLKVSSTKDLLKSNNTGTLTDTSNDLPINEDEDLYWSTNS